MPGSDRIDCIGDTFRLGEGGCGVVYLAELLSTEFITEQRAQGDIAFSPELVALGQNNPKLWQEIRLFFRRKEFVTAMFAMADTAERAKPR